MLGTGKYEIQILELGPGRYETQNFTTRIFIVKITRETAKPIQ